MPELKATKKKKETNTNPKKKTGGVGVRAVSAAASQRLKTSSEKKSASMRISVVGVDGETREKITVPKEVFGMPENKQLLAQAVRVYRINQRARNASTKTRGNVRGSTRKVWKQKGTGRARHGAVTAPIFVGGGIAFGPEPNTVRRRMPKKMRTKALLSALSSKYKDGCIVFVEGLDSLGKKTKEYQKALDGIHVEGSVLVVVHEQAEDMMLGLRNIPNVDVSEARNLHTYAVLSCKTLVITKDAIKSLQSVFVH